MMWDDAEIASSENIQIQLHFKFKLVPTLIINNYNKIDNYNYLLAILVQSNHWQLSYFIILYTIIWYN